MKLAKELGLMAAIATGIGMTACGVEPTETEDGTTPELTLDSLGEQTQGSSYNGWTQAPWGLGQLWCNNHFIQHGLTRFSGDTTRGGGGCFVRKTTTSCTNDNAGDQLCTCGTTTCIDAHAPPTSGSAQGIYGTDAWGYCYSGKCYHRPGSATNWCTTTPAPNRSPGTFVKYTGYFWYDGNDYVLGCMTKTAGPNYACGGSDPSLYMRHVVAASLDTTTCSPM